METITLLRKAPAVEVVKLRKKVSAVRPNARQVHAKAMLEHVIAQFLQRTAGRLAAKVRGMAKLAKAANEEFSKAGGDWDKDKVLNELLPINWTELLTEIGPYMDEIAVQAAVRALYGVNVTDADIISYVNQVASDWAAERSAELVGMRVTDDGEIIENPNAQWAISDTTRNDLKELVGNAFLERTTITDLADRIQEATTFNTARAKMISRTEGARAQTQGNVIGWKGSGVVEKVELQLSNSHKDIDDCDDVQQGGPYPLDEAPQVPIHPNCSCVWVPILEDDDAVKLAKFNENHDEQGRFASGGDGGSGVSEGDKYRSEQVLNLGREWEAAAIQNDPKLQEAREQADKASAKLAKLDKDADRMSSKLDGLVTKRGDLMHERTPLLMRSDYDEQKNIPGSRVALLNEKLDSINNEIDKSTNKVEDVVKKISATYQERDAANEKFSQRISEWATQGQPITNSIGVHTEGAVPGATEHESSVRQFTQLIGGAPVRAENSQVIIRSADQTANVGSGRSYFNPANNSINLSPGADSSTVFHEMGHWLESQVPGGQRAAASFLNMRTANEKEVPLNKYSSGYREDEVTKPDKFRDPYVGKQYGGRATEITSMGIQYLKQDAASFYRADREHFLFTMGMIRGARTGGWEWTN